MKIEKGAHFFFVVSLVSRVLVSGLGELLCFDHRAFGLCRVCLGFFLRSVIVAWAIDEEIRAFLCFHRDFWEFKDQPLDSLGQGLYRRG